MTTTETTPLLARPEGENGHVEPGSSSSKSRLGSWLRRVFDVENRILLAGFLITLSFSFTQVPYVVCIKLILTAYKF